MYRFILPVILALCLLPSDALRAQSGRDFDARRILLYDDAGHQLLLQFMGPTEGVVTFPPGPSTTIGMGRSSFQTLYWNGTAWVPSTNLLNDDTNVTLTGQFISLLPDGFPLSFSRRKP